MADKRIKGITIEIDGNTKKLGEALQDVNKQISKSNAELKDLKSALKLDPKNTELLAQKQEVLAKEIKATTERLNTLKKAQKDMGDYNSLTDEQKENYRALSAEISRTEESLKALNKEFNKSSKFSLDNLNESLTGVRDLSTKLVKDFAKVGVAITGALSTLTIASVKSYAEYEQLVGGVETLFKESADDIKKYAQNAFKTAGLSANEYMETVTSFSASLIQSLEGDTKKATKYADMAITDMSDNANKMGTSMESIQNAYQGFAKQNYTMLDNLKLGYGGTKTEMERLIADANKVKKANGEMANLSISRFSDMVEAIHIIQNEMGITGTTAKEADSTILGSVNSMKASWKNLLTAVSDDNADMSKAVNDFVDSTITAGKNIVPRIRVAIDGIKKLFNSLVREVFPKIKREIPELKPIINIFEWFIDHKSLVVTAIKAIVAAFAVTKIVEFATKVKDAYDKIKLFATGSTTGMIIAGLTAIIGAVTLLSEAFNRETDEEKEARLELERLNDEVSDSVNSWNELKDAQQKQIDSGLTELKYYENLYDELQQITDENGKIKDGYEARADFIVTKLNEAYGTEMKIIGNTIDGYKDLKQSIADVIEQKRANVILSSQESLWQEAIDNETEATNKLIELEILKEKKKKEAFELAQAYNQNTIWMEEATTQAERDQYYMRLQAIDKAIGKKQEEVDEANRLYNEQLDLVQEYAYNKAQYENNMALAHEGKWDEITRIDYKYIKDYKTAEEAEKEMLQERIKTTETHLQVLKDAKEQRNTEMYDNQIKADEKELQELQESLKKYNSTISNNYNGIKESATYMMTGFKQGIQSGSSNIFSSLQSLGKQILSTFKSSLKEASPSKATREMGQFLLEGFSKGIKDDEKALLNQVDSLGNSVLSTLYADTQNAMNGLGGMISTSLNPTINPSVAYDLNYKLMANAMKEALQEVDVELDDRAVGRFIDKTISEEVFN